MRIESTKARKRRFESLKDATGENAKSKAIDKASIYYLRMAGGTTTFPTGALEELMKRATEQGSVTPAEIAEVLGCEELPIEHHQEWNVGSD